MSTEFWRRIQMDVSPQELRGAMTEVYTLYYAGISTVRAVMNARRAESK
jgi:hypothetical protein